MEAGVGEGIFNHHHFQEINKYVTNGWILSMGELLHHSNIRLVPQVDNVFRFCNDDYLMSMVMDKGVRGKDLQSFNMSQSYLQVELISDIINADRGSIRHSIWNGCRGSDDPFRKLPHQPHPTGTIWNTWKQVLR